MMLLSNACTPAADSPPPYYFEVTWVSNLDGAQKYRLLSSCLKRSTIANARIQRDDSFEQPPARVLSDKHKLS